MESSVAHRVCSSLLIVPNAKYSKNDCHPLTSSSSSCQHYHGRLRAEQSWTNNRHMLWKEVKCAKGAGVQGGEEVVVTEEELMGLGRLGDKQCKEVRGVADLLECLEREAIMGDDEGKEPNDYNRRAQIFDKSSKVFQALKRERSTTTCTPS